MQISNSKQQKLTYPMMITIRDTTHSTYWYALCLDLAGGAMYPGGHAFWLIHLNWGRIKNTKPRKKPERNPPI
jgi:hypothetical protein